MKKKIGKKIKISINLQEVVVFHSSYESNKKNHIHNQRFNYINVDKIKVKYINILLKSKTKKRKNLMSQENIRFGFLEPETNTFYEFDSQE